MVPGANTAPTSQAMRNNYQNPSSLSDGDLVGEESTSMQDMAPQPSREPTGHFDVRMGDVVFLTALAKEAHASAAPGLLSCAGLLVGDALGTRRQCTVVPTDSLGQHVKCDTPEGAVDAAAFRLVPLGESSDTNSTLGSIAWMDVAPATARSSDGSSGGSSRSERGRGLLFGQPLLLQHVSSGRFLCTGEPNESLGTIAESAPAELARENGRLALLPPSFVTHGSSSVSTHSSGSISSISRRQPHGRPRECIVASCTFRFLPSINHGRAEVFTGDPLLLATNSGRLVRAGIPHPPSSLLSSASSLPTTSGAPNLNRTNSSNQVRTLRRRSSGNNHGSSFGGALGRNTLGADCSFDAWARPHRFEVDVSRYGSLHEARVAADGGAECGCVQWQLALAAAGNDDVIRDNIDVDLGSNSSGSTDHCMNHRATDNSSSIAHLSTGTVIQMECLEAAALVWAPSACHPLLTDLDGASRVTRRPREVVLQARSHSTAAAAVDIDVSGSAARAAVMGNSNGSSSSGISPSFTPEAGTFSTSPFSRSSRSSSSSSQSGRNAFLSAEAAGTLPVEASLRGLFVIENVATWRKDGQLTSPQAPIVAGQALRFKHLLSGAYLAARTSIQQSTVAAPAGQSQPVQAALVFPPCENDEDNLNAGSAGSASCDDNGGDGECDFPDEAAEFALPMETRRARFTESTAFVFTLAKPSARSSSSPTSPSGPERVPLDAAVGCLTVAGNGPAVGAILGGFTACVEGIAPEVSSHNSTGRNCNRQADQRETLQCPLPVASANLAQFAPYSLVPDEHHWREMCGRSPLSFQSSATATNCPHKKLPGALFQLKAVPKELAAVARFSLKCLGRVAAFERWIANTRLPIPKGRFTTMSTGGSGEEGDQDVATFTYETPTDEELAVADANNSHVVHAHEQLQPLLDALSACAAFLQGQWWPDLADALHDFGSSNGSSSGGAGSKGDSDFAAVTAASQRAFSDRFSGATLQSSGASSSSSAASTVTSADLSMRAQALVRDARILDLFLLVFRALRSNHYSGQYAGAVPALMGIIVQNEQCLLLAAQHNRRTQVALACGRFQGSRCLPGYNPGWLAEATAVVVEWSSNKCAEELREGRPTHLLRTVLFQNPHLSTRVLTAPTIAWFGGLVRTYGLLNHTVSMLSSACLLDDGTSGSGGSNALTQERVHAWLAANNNTNNSHSAHVSSGASGSIPVVKERAITASVGLFFVRKPGPQNHHNRGLSSPVLIPSSGSESTQADASNVTSTTATENLAGASAAEALAEEWAEYAKSPHAQKDKETFRRESLLLYGPERIFRLSVGIDPPERVQELYGSNAWCLNCHLTTSRHRHCAVHGALPPLSMVSKGDAVSASSTYADATSLTNLSSMCRFIDEGEQRDFAAYRATEPLEKDRLLPEVVTWLSPHTARAKAQRDQSNSAASSNGTTGTPDKTVAHQADLAQLVRLARTSEEHRRLVRYAQANLNLHRALATSRRGSLQEALQSKYPYELLLVGFNFYALGHELRTAFINLLDELYLGAYPHTSLPRGPQTVLYVRPLAPRPLRGSIHAVGAVATDFLPRFVAPGYNFVLPPDIRVALHKGNLTTEEWVRNRSSHAFLYRACPGKFDLLTESLMDALADERLLGLVAVNEQAWLQEQADSLEFLRASLGVTSKLVDSGFLYSVQDLQRLVAKLFTVVAALGASTDVTPTALMNSQSYRSTANTKAARNKGADDDSARTNARARPSPQMSRRSPELDRNLLDSALQEVDDNGSEDFVLESPMLNSFASPDDSSPIVLEMVNNPLAGSKAFPAVPPQMTPLPPPASQSTEHTDGAQSSTGESKINRENGNRAMVLGSEDGNFDDSDDEEDRVDDDLWDEVTVAATRKGLNANMLKLVFGRANTAALVLHDELRPDQTLDVVEERQLWTFGQQWHYTSKLPFVTVPTAGSSENPAVVEQYNKDLQVRKKGGFRAFVAYHQKHSSLWSSSDRADNDDADGTDDADDTDGPELQGPCTAPDSPDGLPPVPFGSEASLPPGWTTWRWLEPWRLDTLYLDARGSQGDSGSNGGLELEDCAWGYSSCLHSNRGPVEWEPTERRGHLYRRRIWRRRRERKSAVQVALELVSQGHCSIKSCRTAIAASREHAVSDARQHARTLRIAAVPVPASSTRTATVEFAENSEGIWDDASGITEGTSLSFSSSEGTSKAIMRPSAKRLDVDLLASSCKPLKSVGNLAPSSSTSSSSSMSTMSLIGTQEELNAVATLCVMLDLPMRSRVGQPAKVARAAFDAAARLKTGSVDNSSSSLGASPALGLQFSPFSSTGRLLNEAAKGASAKLHDKTFETAHGGCTNNSSDSGRGKTLINESAAPLGELEIAAALLTKYKCYGHTLSMLERVQDKAVTVRVAALLERLREAFVFSKIPAVHVASQGSGSQGGNGDGEYERDLRRMFLAHTAGNDVSSVHEVHRICFHVSGSSSVVSPVGSGSSNSNNKGNGNPNSGNSGNSGTSDGPGYFARRSSSNRMLGRDASASAQARVVHAQRTPDGRPRSAQEARMSTRRVVLFVRRLQQVFFDTGLHPKEVFGRFMPSKPANGLPPPKVGASSVEALKAVSKEDWALGVPPQPLDLVTFQWLLSGLGFTLSSDDVASLRDAFCDDGEAALEAAEAAAFAAGHRLRGGQGNWGERRASKQASRLKAAAARVAERRLRAAQRQKHVELVDAAKLLACLEAVPPPVPAELSAPGEELWASLFKPEETPALDPLRLSQPPAATSAAAAASTTTGATANTSQTSEATAAAPPEEGLLPMYRIFLETSQAAASGAAGVAPTAFALAERSLRCMFRAFETRAETLTAVESSDPVHPPLRHSPTGHSDPANGDVVRGLTLLRHSVQRLLSWARDGPDGSSDSQVASVLARAQTLFRYLAHLVMAQRRAGNSDASRALYQYLLVQAEASNWAIDMLCLPGIAASTPHSASSAAGRRDSARTGEQLEVPMDMVPLRTASAHLLLVLLEGCDHAVVEHIVRRWPDVCAAMLAVPDGAGQFKNGIVQVVAAMLKWVGGSVNESTLNSWAAAIRRWDLGTDTEAIDEDLTRHEDAIAYFGLLEVFLMDCNNVPVPSIQDSVFRALTNQNLILTFYDASSPEPFVAQPGFERRRALLRASEEPPLGEDASHAEGGPVYGSWDEMMANADKTPEVPSAGDDQDISEPEAEHYMIMLHARSLHCLSLCCRGTHEAANTAALSAVELLPVPALVASLCDTTTDALTRSGGADWVPTVGAEAAIHMGRGIMVAPWGHTIALRAAAAFLDHTVLCRTPPVGLDNASSPSSRAGNVEWPLPALRAVDRYNLLLWAADCGTLLRRFARTLTEHAAYARTDYGADAFARNRDKGQLRLSHGTVGAIYLASNGHVTAQTIHCLLGALVPALATLHLCLRPVPAHDPREDGQMSDNPIHDSVEYSQKMSNAHAVAWTSIHSSLVALLESPLAVRHLQRVASAICPNLRYKLDNEFLAAARKLRARLLIDAMVTEEEDEEDEEARSSSVDGSGSDSGHGAASSSPVTNQESQSVASSAKGASSVDSSFSFVDVCEVAEDARKDFAHLVEVSSDPRHHVALDQGYCTFGSVTSNLHSLGITVSNLPLQMCKPSALRKVFSRFGRIRFAYIRSMPARKNRNEKTSTSGGTASVYFDLAYRWNFGGAFSGHVFDADEYMLSSESSDANKELIIRVVCLPTYTSNEIRVKRSDHVVTLLQRISTELTDGVPVVDLTMAMNSLELRRNYSMGTLHRHFDPSGKFGANWNQVELANNSTSTPAKWVKHEGGVWAEAPTPALTLVISWNPAIAAARCLDGVLSSFLVQAVTSKKGTLNTTTPTSNVQASKLTDESTEISSETETLTSGMTSVSLEKNGLLKSDVSDAPKHVEGVSVLVEDSSIESFWRKYGEALRASTRVTDAIDAEASNLATFFLELPKRSSGTFREPEVLASFIKFVRTFLETRDNSYNVMSDAQDLTAAQIVELLCRMAALAAPDKPFRLNATWSDLRLAGMQNAPTASADLNADRRVVADEYSPQETSRLLFRTALVEAGALELLIDVLSQRDTNLCRLYHAGLKLGKFIFSGGNLRAQNLLAEHLRRRQNTYMVGMFCGIADFAAAHFRRRAAAIDLLGVQVGVPYAGCSPERLEHLRARAAKKLPTGAPLDPAVFDSGISRRGGQRAAPVPIKSVLELCKMLCENHHRPMQDILRDCQESQDSFGSSADRDDTCTDSFSTEWMKKLNAGFSVKFIESSIKLIGAITGSTIATAPDLQHLRGSAFLLFDIAIDFLTECTQGPNKQNQAAIINFQGSLHIVRCLNILFSWMPGTHFLSIHSPFVNLCTDCAHKAVVLLHALIEGRPASFSDPVVWKIYSTISANAFLYRLDRLASIVHFLDKVRHKKAIKLKHDAKKAKLAQSFECFYGWCGQRHIRSLHAERSRVSFETVFLQLRDGEQLSEIPPANEIEAPWQRQYTSEFHYHNLIFIGAIFVTFVEALHSIEAPYGASRFRLHANRNSTKGNEVSEAKHSELLFSSGAEENDSEDEEDSSDDDANANEGTMVLMQANANHGEIADRVGIPTTSTSRTASTAPFPDLFGSMGDEAMIFEQQLEKIRSLQMLQTKKFGRQRRMFSDLVLSIEVQDSDHGLVRVFFPRPAVCLFLSEQQKQTVYERLDFTAADSQVLREFLRMFRSITDEIAYKKRLANKPLLGMFLRVTTNESYEVFPWFLAMSINFMLAISISHTGSDGLGPYEFDPPSFERGVFGLGTLLLAANLAEVISTLALQAPILWAGMYRRIGDEWLREDRLGPVPARDVISDVIRAFSFPAAYSVTALVARELLMAAGVDRQSIALTQVMRFLALILALPFVRAARKLFGNRPFILNSGVQAIVLAYDAATMEGLLWKLVFTTINVVAVSGHPLLFSFQILSVLNFSPTLRNVVKAVRGPIEQLLMTCFLGMLVIYIFMVIAFWAFPEDLQDKAGYYPQPEDCDIANDVDACEQPTMCKSMISCFAVFMVNGLIMGGGIGEFISSELGNAPPIGADRTMSRYLFDLAFFAVVTIGLLNLIFGIIVDTFSSLREHENEELRTRNNKCIICGLTRQEFERIEPGAWRNHYKYEHNIWAYYCFLVHLETKEPTDFNGLEDYVASCVRQNSIAWIPRNASIFLGTTSKDENPEAPPIKNPDNS